MKKKPVPAAPADISIGLRRYLYFTAATTGAVILIVEILGAKMLSPYLGTSHFVWTAQIAVTLVSLAIGYYLGGWLVDRSQKLANLYGLILLAALHLSLTIGFCEPVAYWCLRFKLAAGSILASLFLFFVPLTLLAAVGPFLIRVLTHSVSAVGSQVGRLSAISTLGSVLGTVLISYLLIPFLANSVTMYLTAGALLAVTGGFFLTWGRRGGEGAAILIGMVISLLAGYVGVGRAERLVKGDRTELFRHNSDFGLLQVIRDDRSGNLYYINDYLTQNTYDPAARQSVSLFTYMLHDLARAYTPHTQDVLCIGMGVGIVPMRFAHEGAKVDVVEINPGVVPVAERYFHLEKDRLNLVIGDGRQFLNGCGKRYDAIVLDAFLGDSSPSHLMTQEAFAAMRRALKPEGVLVINSFGEFDPGLDFFTASLDKTLKSVFRQVRIHHSGNGNVFFVAADRRELRLLRQPDLAAVHPFVQREVEAAFAGIAQTNPRSGMILTDDHNPVEYYDAANRERLRRQLAMNMRGHLE